MSVDTTITYRQIMQDKVHSLHLKLSVSFPFWDVINVANFIK